MYYLSPLPQFLIHSHELALDSSLHYFGLNYSPLALSLDLVWNFDVRKTGMPSVSSCSMQELLAGHKIIDSSVLWNWLVISPNGGSTMIVFWNQRAYILTRVAIFERETTSVSTRVYNNTKRRYRCSKNAKFESKLPNGYCYEEGGIASAERVSGSSTSLLLSRLASLTALLFASLSLLFASVRC